MKYGNSMAIRDNGMIIAQMCIPSLVNGSLLVPDVFWLCDNDRQDKLLYLQSGKAYAHHLC